MNLLKYGNAKLNNTLVFNLPAGKSICGLECAGCYAMKFQRIYPNVLPYRERMYQASLSSSFVSDIVSDIRSCRKPFSYVRIHESGEFYSQQYIDKWATIARLFPDITFYAYTKRLSHFDFTSLLGQENFVLINSLHFGPLNYGPLGTEPTSSFVCPSSDTVRCGLECSYCMTKTAQYNSVWFVKH